MLNRVYKFRILLVALGLLSLFMAAIVRLYYLQVVRHDFYVEKGEDIHVRQRKIDPFRGEIVDRNGAILAVTNRMMTVYSHPPSIPEKNRSNLAEDLTRILHMPQDRIESILEKKYHVPVIRKIPREQAETVAALRKKWSIPYSGLYLREESKRLYPKKELLAPVLGFTTIDNTGDNKGIFGLEMEYNDWISGKYEKTIARKTALHNYLDPTEAALLESTYGNRIVLTIDQSIQYSCEKALRKALVEWEADSGVMVVQEVKTGKMLAMCSLPSYDPNKFETYDASFRRNRCISDCFEPGSVMKTFTSAILLELGLVSMDEIIDCENGRAIIDGRRVTDAGGHSMGRVTFPETYYHSSNIAFSKLALRIDPPVYYTFLSRLGFGEETGIDLPDESAGILHPLTKWTRLSRTSLGIGYEIGLTPVQTITAISAMANGGKLMRPCVVSEIQDFRGRTVRCFEPKVRRRVIRPEVSEKVLQLMEGVVREGTGKKAAIPGYRIGSKTGTTRKSHKSEPEYIASFASVFPISDPEIAVYVAVDNPKGGYYAAQVAAPVFREVATHILSHLAIEPDAPDQLLDKAVAEKSSSTKPVSQISRSEDIIHVPTIDGQMPDLRGLTMRQVKKRMENIPVPMKFVGSGIVIEQNPPPAAELDGYRQCVMLFGKEIKIINTEDGER